jgi:hypothetical protein
MVSLIKYVLDEHINITGSVLIFVENTLQRIFILLLIGLTLWQFMKSHIQKNDSFRVGNFIETGGQKGTVEHISLRSLRLRNPRGPVHTIPFGSMGTVTNNSRDYIISKLDFRVRYDTDVDKVRKIIKKINIKIMADEERAR